MHDKMKSGKRKQMTMPIHYKPRVIFLLSVVLIVALFWLYYKDASPTAVSPEIRVTAQAQSLMKDVTTIKPTRPTQKFSEIIVHFDLKGAPPLLPYYKQLFPLLKRWGATGILMEYEDTFPYSGTLEALHSNNAYSKQDIRDVLALAKENNLSVIPLIQAFGHLEFALKLPELKALREVAGFPNMLCPSKPASLEFLKAMIGQVMALHPESRYLHIGCDEVYQLGECPICQKRGLSKDHLFLDHMLAVVGHVSRTFNVVPLIWDDMFRHFPLETLLQSNVSKSGVQPVVWNYLADNFSSIQPSWHDYRQAFDHVWAASAFKGATRSDAMVTNITHHLENHINWLDVLTEQKPLFEKEGKSFDRILITGWQRYNHFASFCELMPVGLPSLAVSMKLLQHNDWNDEMKADLEKELGFLAGTLDLLADPVKCSPHSVNQTTPNFPGGEVFRAVHNWCAVRNYIEDLVSGPTRNTWLSDYNVRHQRISPIVLKYYFLRRSDSDTNNGTFPNKVARDVQHALSEIYHEKTVQEWMDCFVQPHLERFVSVRKKAEEMLNVFSRPSK